MGKTGFADSNTRIYLVRHGEVHNPAKILYGRLPRFRLSERGRRQAMRAALNLKEMPLVAVYSSPLLRARQTAEEILCYHPLLTLKKSALINEVYFPFQGDPAAAVDARNGDVYSGVGPTYEQPEDILARMQNFLWRVRKRYAGRQVVAVCHGDLILFTLLWAAGRSVTVKNKIRFTELGIIETYPATGSITTLCYRTSDRGEHPRIDYRAPNA
jgi:broad specificity phosphatase PhoE